MNCFFTLCILAATFVCLHAAPRLAHSDLPGNVGSMIQWSDCTKSSDHGKINSITITPNPPVKGQKLSITANTTIDEEVTGGSVKILLTIYDFVPIHAEHIFDLCEFLQDVKKNCPVPKGTLDFTIDNEVPMDVLDGIYNGNITAIDQNNQEVFCINFNYKFCMKSIHKQQLWLVILCLIANA